jgi:DNA-binding transcriptional MocR family regulator
LHIEFVPVRVDQHGVDPNDLQRQVRRTGARTLVCMPCLQNPLGVTMTAARRNEIAAVVRNHGVTLIEDDVYGPLQDEPMLANVAPESTVIVTSISKTVAPGLRFGCVTGAHPAVAQMRADVHLTSWLLSPAPLATATEWIATDIAWKQLTLARTETAARARLADRILGRGPAAPHRWYPVEGDPQRAAEIAPAHGVTVVPSSALCRPAQFGTA